MIKFNSYSEPQFVNWDNLAKVEAIHKAHIDAGSAKVDNLDTFALIAAHFDKEGNALVEKPDEKNK